MPRCTRKGCQAEYTEDSTEKCTFHPGNPVFHEGLKSWSCCSEVYKPVLDFDEFMKIPGCTQTDRHITEAAAPKPEAPKPQLTPTPSAKQENGAEVYTNAPTPKPKPKPAPAPAPAPTPVVEEEDDLEAVVAVGTTCKRKGCGVAFVSNEVNRVGDGEGTVCMYHPMPPIFHEGSKGYLCCKRRVLEFDEFLKIEGCKQGRHVFVAKATAAPETEQLTTCRIDHYQTLDRVQVSIFAKQVDKARSVVKFEQNSISVDLYMPGSKRFLKTVELFGPIDPDASSFTYFGTKVELSLKKTDTRSWTVLERTEHDLGNIAFTFGVGGRTGTIGAKESVLDANNKLNS